MKSSTIVSLIALIWLGGCSKATDGIAGATHHGRYAGVGLYPAGRMWEQLARANPAKDAGAATVQDDEQVIVVVDSNTGELRQCGNLSGHCLSMSPWARPVDAPQIAPTLLQKHAAQLDQEAEARSGQADVKVQARIAPEPAVKTH